MASNLCQHDEPAATWSCACSPVFKFCSTCLLTHVQSPSGPHTVSYSGQPGKFVCGLCKTMSDDPVSCRYPVSLCKKCIATYPVVAERQDLPLEAYAKEAAAAVPEGEAKRRAEIPEEALKQRAEQGGVQSLQAMLTQKRNDARQHLTQVLENINSFEEIIARALYLEDKLQETKDNLRVTEATLAERTAEVQRLQAAGPAAARGLEEGQIGQFASIVGRVETVSRDNERLMTENQHLTQRIQAAERQLADQQSLNQQIEQLSKEIAQLKTELQLTVHQEMEKVTEQSAIQLQETLQDQLQETARLAAQKVSEVIPLVAHLEVDNECMDVQTIESLFKLASLVISEQLRSADMRHVARVCLLFAKLLGPCEDMAIFSENIRKVLLNNSERGIALLQNLEEIYAKTKDYEAAKELLKGLMRLVGTAEFDDSISIASRFAKVLSLAPLCDFTLAVTHFFAQDDPRLTEWRQVLTVVPVEWTDKQLATESIGTLVEAIVAAKFDSTYLHLAKLVQTGRLQDPATVLTFVGRAAKLLKNDPPRQSLNAFILGISALLESASKLPQDEFRVLAERVFASTKLVKENATMSEIVQLTTLLHEMTPGKPSSRTTYRFVDSLPKFRTEKNLIDFASGMLAWMLPLGQPKADLKFADTVLSQLDQSRSFEDSAQMVGALLYELSKTRAPSAERCFIAMINLRIPLEIVTEFCLVLLTSFLTSPAAAEVDLFLQIWIQLLETHGNLVEVTGRVIALMKGGMSESILQTLKCFSVMKLRNLPAAFSFANEAITALRVTSERESMNRLLHDLFVVMAQSNQPHDLAGKAVNVWMLGKTRLPGDLCTYSFCSYVLQQLQQEKVATLLDDFLALLNQENAAYSVAYRLAEISVIDASPPAQLSPLLKTLKELRGVETLSALFEKLATLRLQKAARALFLRITFNFVTKKPAEVQELARTLAALLSRAEAIPLLEHLASLTEFGLVCDILDAARSSADPSTATVGAQLASMYKACEDQGVREAALSANLKTALLDRCADIAAILPHLQILLQNPLHRMAALCVRLMIETASRGPDAKELLCFIAEKSVELLAAVQPDVVIAFWGVVLDARDASQIQTVKQLQSGFPQLKDKLVELLNRLQGRATLVDVDGLMPKHTQERELVNVQPSLIRFFNIQDQQWNPATALRKAISCDSTYCSYVILDDGKVFACGG